MKTSSCHSLVLLLLVWTSPSDTGVSVALSSSNASVLLLDSRTDTLYVGARDAILVLSATNLSTKHSAVEWPATEKQMNECKKKSKSEDECRNYICLLERLADDIIYVCGSYAFSPQCAFIDPVSFTLQTDGGGAVKMESGKGKCPFKPGTSHTSITAGGDLYSASGTNFLGTEFDIARVTRGKEVRLEPSINSLNDPWFVASAGVNDHVFWFFSETAREYSFYQPVRVTRVARICTSDVGGSKILQKRWSSFIKTTLVCRAERGGRRYGNLTHLYPLEHSPGNPNSTHFYGLFTSQWGGEQLSAVCVFSVSAVNEAMLTGRFADIKSQCKSSIGIDPPSGPRPGQCITGELRSQGVQSSLDLPDQVLSFSRDHPLLLDPVETAPLLVKTGTTYTSLVVSHVTGNQAIIIHLATDQGELHSVYVSDRVVSALQETSLISTDSVTDMITTQDHVLALSPSSLSRVPVTDCSSYASCQACSRARLLGCLWEVNTKTCQTDETTPRSTVSIGPYVDVLQQCGTVKGRCSPQTEELSVSVGLTVLLACQPPLSPSPLSCVWSVPQGQRPRQLLSGSLEVLVSSSSGGDYSCSCPGQGENASTAQSCLTASYRLLLLSPRPSPVGIYLAFVLLGALGGALAMALLMYRRGLRTLLAGRNCGGQEPANENLHESNPNFYENEVMNDGQATSQSQPV